MVVVMLHAVAVNAEVAKIIGVGEYYMNDENETLEHAKTQATLRAKLHVLEQARVNVTSHSSVRDANLTEDEIVTVTAGIIYVTGTKENIADVDGVLIAVSEVIAEVDLDKVAELVELEINRRGGH